MTQKVNDLQKRNNTAALNRGVKSRVAKAAKVSEDVPSKSHYSSDDDTHAPNMPKVNPLRKDAGSSARRENVTDANTLDLMTLTLTEHLPCAPPDDHGQRDKTESFLKKMCPNLTEVETMVCLAQMAHYNEEEHKGMVPCFRCTRPGTPCEPKKHCESWNRTRVDQSEGSDHYQLSLIHI